MFQNSYESDYRVFSEGDNGVTIDGKNTEGVSPDLLGVLHQWSALKRPHALSISCSLGRTLIKEREYGVFAHPGKIFFNCRSASTGRR